MQSKPRTSRERAISRSKLPVAMVTAGNPTGSPVLRERAAELDADIAAERIASLRVAVLTLAAGAIAPSPAARESISDRGRAHRARGK